jgi:hypothetical protein
VDGTLLRVVMVAARRRGVDLDAKIIVAHWDKELAAPTFNPPSGTVPCWRSSITATAATGKR